MKGLISLSGLLLAFTTVPSYAAVVSGALTGGSALTNGGSFQLINPAPGFTVGNNNQQSNNLFAFDERSNATLLVNVAAQFGGNLTAGSVFDSHYVFFDPQPNRRAIGSVTFANAIVAVLSSTASGMATDASFGKAGVTYLSPGARGLENGDVFNVVGNTLTLDWTASSPGDYIRVLTATAAVPEPASWALMIAGFGLVGSAMRRRRVSFALS